jgi:isoprenylcysteine carboxyl methyltransferase (ICMT) family protein YpbQ
VEYPDNGAYMVAAYVVAAVIILTYAISLYLRVRRETKE